MGLIDVGWYPYSKNHIRYQYWLRLPGWL